MAGAKETTEKHARNAANKPLSLTVHLPDIPLWVPDERSAMMLRLTRNTMGLALTDLAGHVSDAAPRSEGILAQSFGANPAGATGGIEMIATTTNELNGRVFSSLPYAIVMDQGRKPGSPISRAGIDSIGLWAQRKLGLSATEAGRAKWAIATHIVRFGIEGKNYAKEGWDSAKPRMESLFSILATEMTKSLVGKGK